MSKTLNYSQHLQALATPVATRQTPRDWLRAQAAKLRRNQPSIVSRAMATHAVNGAINALESDNPFTLD